AVGGDAAGYAKADRIPVPGAPRSRDNENLAIGLAQAEMGIKARSRADQGSRSNAVSRLIPHGQGAVAIGEPGIAQRGDATILRIVVLTGNRAKTRERHRAQEGSARVPSGDRAPLHGD